MNTFSTKKFLRSNVNINVNYKYFVTFECIKLIKSHFNNVKLIHVEFSHLKVALLTIIK